MATQYSFGTGQLYATPVGGGAPVKFATLQDVDVSFQADLKQLHGQYSFPVAVARGKQKVDVKAGNANIDVGLFNTIFFDETAGTTTGSYAQAIDEAASVPAMGPYTVTVSNSAHFYVDLGVRNATTGAALTQVASMPATGQYSVSAGVYTFNSAQSGTAMLFNYIYQVTASGTTLVLSNQLMGIQPSFRLILAETFQNNWLFLQLNYVTCGKLSLPLKLDDFTIPELEFTVGVDSNNSLGLISTSV